MVHKVIDRCKETTSTTGTGNLTLTGAVSGFVAMADANIGLTTNGDTSWFCAVNGTEWEVFLGTRLSATSLERTSRHSSSNAGAAVNFSAAPVVFSTVPGVYLNPGPIFSAYRSTDQTGVANNTYTKVQLDSEEFDSAGCFDNATNHRFTPNVAGYYRFEWNVQITGTTMTGGATALYKNGASVKAGSYFSPLASISLSNGAALVYLNGSTDYVELFGYISASSGHKFAGSSINTFLSGSYIGP
jgi:hypothetical protein